uniref:Putative secreted protein n=1 Tax=Anopheles darlingi TaxID=43151 RepID=A0A2M4DCF5_ANODA
MRPATVGYQGLPTMEPLPVLWSLVLLLLLQWSSSRWPVLSNILEHFGIFETPTAGILSQKPFTRDHSTALTLSRRRVNATYRHIKHGTLYFTGTG